MPTDPSPRSTPLRRHASRGLPAALMLGLAVGPAAAFEVAFDASDFTTVVPSFSQVTRFEVTLDVVGPLRAGVVYDNAAFFEIAYLVEGSLSPGTPSNFPAFFLDRRPASQGGPIDAANWRVQGSTLEFEIAPGADLADGLQLSELVPDPGGVILRLDAREFERLDVARYHPPRLLLFDDGTGTIENSNNSSGSTGTTNPATQMTVDVDYGDEYLTALTFDAVSFTLVPEPAAAPSAALALAALAGLRRVRTRPARAAAGTGGA